MKQTIKSVRGKIILVDDDKIEKEFLSIALQSKGWKIGFEYFSTALDAIEYLKSTKDEIFLIISDMNMPKISGLEFKKAIDTDSILKKKSIPFIFTTSAASKAEITEAYDYRVQGYFKKPETIEEQAETLDIIIRYWIISQHPNRDRIA
jgi:CheY-like chemotaxis protein